MTLRIITGTIVDAKDTFGKMAELIEGKYFIKWILTEEGWVQMKPTSISVVNDLKFSIIQTTGSGKTILGVTYSYVALAMGINIGGNLSLKWTDNNKGKKKDQWQPVINCMEDLEAAKFMHIILDDVRSTISSWNTKDAKMVSEVANATRKKGNWIDITTQRIENFIPPDLKLISDEIIVPYIRVVDKTQPSPDGRGKPLQIIALRFSPGYDFLDYKVYNFNTKVGDEILGGYDTLQLAVGLKDGESRPRPNQQPGNDLEIECYNELKRIVYWYSTWKHIPERPNEFEIKSYETDYINFAIDVCKKQESGYLETSSKNWQLKRRLADMEGRYPLLCWKDDEWYFSVIKDGFPFGRDINIAEEFMFCRAFPLEYLPKIFRIYPPTNPPIHSPLYPPSPLDGGVSVD